MTNQRRTIIEELKNLKSHPTADELYRVVKRRIPGISLGTIYRNLEMLSGSGIIQKIEVPGTAKRFDGNAENHYHMRCMYCGVVVDIHTRPLVDIGSISGDLDGHQIVEYRLELIGICRACNEKKVSSEKMASPGVSGKSDWR